MGRPFLRRLSSSTRTAPTIPDLETIESSLRNCSLAGRRRLNQLPAGGLGSETADIAVELNSEVPLPYLWEQVLNIQTGEIYYINRADGTKTIRDPRLPLAALSRTPSDSEPESAVEDGDEGGDSTSDDSSDNNSTSSTSSNTSCYNGPGSSSFSASSTISIATSTSSTASSAPRRPRCARGTATTSNPVLVLVGCRVCLTLSMVPRSEEECPKCGSGLLLHF